MQSRVWTAGSALMWIAALVMSPVLAGCESAPAAANAPQHDASDAAGGDAKSAAGGNCHLGQICSEICNGIDDDCDGLTDETATGSPGLCDDGNPCTADSCGGTQGCVNLAANGTACDDGDSCSGPDQCQGGVCAGAPLSCDDQNPCTVDACVPGSGCSHTGGVGAVCGGTGVCSASGCACPDGEVVTANGTCGACTCSVAGSAVTLPQPVTALYSPSLGGDTNYGRQVFFRGSQLFVSSPGAMGLPETSSPNNPNAGRGAVFVYQHTAGGWLPQTRIDLANLGNYRGFGREIAVNPQGDRLAVTSGEVSNSLPASQVWVYERDASGAWHQVAGPFVSPTPIPATAQNFNWASGLALDGDWLAIGDATRDQQSTDQDRGRVILAHRAANGTWALGQTLWGAASEAMFGTGVAMQGTTLAISAPSVTGYINGIAGTVTIATLQNGTWTTVQTLTAPPTGAALPSDGLGYALQLHGDDLYVGRETGGCSAQGLGGSIVHFRRSGGTFALVGNVAPATANCNDDLNYGRTFALDGNNLVAASATSPYLPLLRLLVPTMAGTWQPAWRKLAPLPPSAQGPLVWAPTTATSNTFAFFGRNQLAADNGRLAFLVFAANKPVIEVFEPSAGLCNATGACDCLPGYSGADCSLAACQTAGDCDDQNPCTTDGCVAQNGSNACVHTANGGPCDDGDACTAGESCSGGKCQPGTVVSCDDQNACTADSCSPSEGCVHLFGAGPCDDGKACTLDDTCQLKIGCQGTPFNCDDQNPCTVDACKEPSGGATTPSCVHTNIPGSTVPCDDGDACTTGTVCKFGACVGGGDTVCDDGDPCTFDTCDPQSGCSSQFNVGMACGAGGVCTLAGCICPSPQVLQASGTCGSCACAVGGSLAGQFSAVDSTAIGVPEAPTPVSGAPHAHNHTQLQTVAMGGDYLVTGWLMNDLAGAPVKGLVRVLKKQGGQWQFVQDLGHPSGTAGPAGPATTAQLNLARFGMNVALNADATRLAVSTFALDSIVIFARTGTTFAYETTLWPPAGAEGNRTQVLSLTGDILAIGHEHYSSQSSYDPAPALRIYQRQANGQWLQQADSAATSPVTGTSHLGRAVAAVAGSVLVGAPAVVSGLPQQQAGRVLVYSPAAGTWSHTATLVAPQTSPGDGFGWQLAAEGNTLVVASRYGGCATTPASLGQLGSGGVWLYTRAGATAPWQLAQQLVPQIPSCQGLFSYGYALAVQGDDVLVGAPHQPSTTTPGVMGTVHRFHRQGASWVWTGELRVPVLAPLSPVPVGWYPPVFAGSSDMQGFGRALAIYGGVPAVWAPRMTPTAYPAPALYTFGPVAGSCTSQGNCLCAPGYVGTDCATQQCATDTQCDDGNVCTADACSKSPGSLTGTCDHGPLLIKFLECSDGNPCTQVDFCKGGSCLSGALKDCNDGKFCTDDYCDPVAGGCVNKLIVGCKG